MQMVFVIFCHLTDWNLDLVLNTMSYHKQCLLSQKGFGRVVMSVPHAA